VLDVGTLRFQPGEDLRWSSIGGASLILGSRGRGAGRWPGIDSNLALNLEIDPSL
jgi:hypothetical protein